MAVAPRGRGTRTTVVAVTLARNFSPSVRASSVISSPDSAAANSGKSKRTKSSVLLAAPSARASKRPR